MIYLASPYTHEDKRVESIRFDDVLFATSFLMSKGEVVFSPIVHCHLINVRFGTPGDWEYWKNYDKEFIRVCDRFIILKLNGWEKSIGVTAEREFALSIGRTIEFLEPCS